MTFNIDEIYREMESVMQNNCVGTSEERFNEAKEIVVKSLSQAIEDNREDLIEGLEE